jgi:capsular exopolysaccharide synthesis family protein
VPLPEFSSGLAGGMDNLGGSKFNFQKFRLLLVQYWWVPMATLLISMLVAGVQVWHQRATYFSVGSMWETMKLQLPDGSQFNESAEDLPGTQSDLLRSALIKDRALAKLRAASNNLAIPVDLHGGPLPVDLRLSQTTKSAVFTLQAIGPQPAYTQAYLEALMEAYLEYKADIRKQISGDTLASIVKQVQLTAEELKNQQEVLTEFAHTNNLAILQEEGAVAGGYLTKLKTQLSDLQAEEGMLEAAAGNLAGTVADRSQTNQMAHELEALISLHGAEAAGLVTAFQNKFKELDMLTLERAKFSVNLRAQHPKMQQLDAEIERAQHELDIFHRQSSEQLSASLETTRMRMANVQNAIKDWEARVVDANTRIAESERLKTSVTRSQGEYDRLAALAQNFKISRNFDQETLAILEHASPARRSYGAMKQLLASAAVVGLCLGFGGIALLTVRDEKFGSISEVREKLGDNVIAQVPEWPQANGQLPLSVNGELSHIYAESYRSLRSALLFLVESPQRPKLILITSALPNEGKSTVAANLAHTLALGGARVLLVDADLRRGTLHERLNLNSAPGFSHLLNHPADADKMIQTSSVPNLSFIASGSRVANPGDQLLGVALDELLAGWRAAYDYVLIDSCPVFAADDAATLAAKVDGTLLVVRSRFSSARQVKEALDILCHRRANVLGVVFNRADTSSPYYDGYKYSKYYTAADMAAA